MNKADFLNEVLSRDKHGWINKSAPKKKSAPAANLPGVSELNELNQFYSQNNRAPRVDGGIAEMSLAFKLRKLRAERKKHEHLKDWDENGLIWEKESESEYAGVESIKDIIKSKAFAKLSGVKADNSIFNMKNVSKDSKQTRKFRGRGKRDYCVDFEAFEPIFKDVHLQLKEGTKILDRIQGDKLEQEQIRRGSFFLVKGMLAYVAEIGEIVQAVGGATNRCRIIFENGSESNMTRRSFSVRLRSDEGHRIISRDHIEFNARPLQNEVIKDISGYVYVARTMHPKFADKGDMFKIGLTKREVSERFKDCENDTAFLKSKAERLRILPVYGFKLSSVEGALHSAFEQCRIDIEFYDDQGKPHKATEWFHVPLVAIDQAVDFIQRGEIHKFVFNRDSQRFERR